MKFDILSDLESSIVSVHLPKGVAEDEVVAEVAAAEVPSVQDEKKAEKEAQAE